MSINLTIIMVKIVSLQKTDSRILQKRKAELLRRLQTPAELVRASYVLQYLSCGKANCRCRRGFKHGPFYYLVQCLGTSKVQKFLLKNPEQRKQVRLGIDTHLKFQRQLAEH